MRTEGGGVFFSSLLVQMLLNVFSCTVEASY